MPDFIGVARIKVQPETVGLPVGFTFAACTSATANDGSLPYGDTISSAVVKAYDPSGNDVTASMVTTAAAVDGFTVSCRISYYSGIASGLHKLTAVLTLASGYVDEFDCRRIMVQDT